MIKPAGNLVLVEEHSDADKVTSSGIVIASAYTRGPKKGTVISIGPGEQNYKGEIIPVPDLEVGEVIFYPEHSGTDIEDEDGKKYVLLSCKNIIAKKS